VTDQTIIGGKDRKEASAKAAEALIGEIERILGERTGALTVAWCGGTSPNEIFAPFIERFAAVSPAKREQVQLVLVDERRVPLGDEQSNFRMLKQGLFDPLVKAGLIRAAQVHPFPVELEPEAAAAQYTRLVRDTLGGLHIAILGVGPDGHVAGIFPGHSSIKRDGAQYYFVPDRPKPPSEGFSASRELIAAAEVGFLLFFGKEKQKPLDDYFAGTDPIAVPARVGKGMKRVVVVTDLAG